MSKKISHTWKERKNCVRIKFLFEAVIDLLLNNNVFSKYARDINASEKELYKSI